MGASYDGNSPGPRVASTGFAENWGNMPIRVLVADDSPLVAAGLSRILEEDPEIRVVGHARDGEEAFALVTKLRPDLVTMDIHMPILDGLDAIERIMAYAPTPILVITGDPRGDALTFDALTRGALDLITKPTIVQGHAADHGALRRKVKLLATVPVVQHVAGRKRDRRISSRNRVVLPEETRATIVAIVSSTGGPQALPRILAPLRADFPVGIAIVQHITDGFAEGLATWLNSQCALEVRLPRHGQILQPGQVFIAPSGVHMKLDVTGRVSLDPAEPVAGHRPSGDVLLTSVAEAFGSRAVGVILTGMQRDGVMGLKAIFDRGGTTIAQDEATSIVFGMPKAAIELGVVKRVLPLESIASALAMTVGAPGAVPSSQRIAVIEDAEKPSSDSNRRPTSDPPSRPPGPPSWRATPPPETNPDRRRPRP